MPRFKLPPEPKAEPANKEMAVSSDDGYRRRIHLPVNEAILDAVKVDDEVVVTLRGAVMETRKEDSADHNERDLTVKVTEVEVYQESDEMAEEEFRKGYRRGAGSKR